MASEHEAADATCGSGQKHAARMASATPESTAGEAQQHALQPLRIISVPRVQVGTDGTPKLLRYEELFRREVHDMGLDSEHGWEWLRPEFSHESPNAISVAEKKGLQFHERCYYLASSSKGA